MCSDASLASQFDVLRSIVFPVAFVVGCVVYSLQHRPEASILGQLGWLSFSVVGLCLYSCAYKLRHQRAIFIRGASLVNDSFACKQLIAPMLPGWLIDSDKESVDWINSTYVGRFLVVYTFRDKMTRIRSLRTAF
jgi:hypothetical protein